MKRFLILLAFIATSAHAEIYTWTDSRGVAHYTNKLDEVPDRYRAKVKSLNYDTGQKTETPAPQQNAPARPEVLRQKSAEPRPAPVRPTVRSVAPEEE